MTKSRSVEQRVSEQVEGARLWTHLQHLGAIGASPADGPGVWRPSWSASYQSAQRWLVEVMRDAGLDVWIDAIGNTWGSWAVGNPPALVIGSHIDAVPGGGMFDGTLGILGAIEAIKTLRKAGFVPRREIRIVAWIEEEGRATGMALLGSRAFTGKLSTDECESLARQLVTVSKSPDADEALSNLKSSVMRPGDVREYLELHVEQGPVLWESNLDIGVVTGIVAVESGQFDIHGVTNHAGGTPMNQRKDAVVAAAQVVLAVRDIAVSVGVRATCGAVEVEHAASNVIPGEVRVSLDVRSAGDAGLRAFWKNLGPILDGIRSGTGVAVDFSKTYSFPAVTTDAALLGLVEAAAQSLDLSSTRMVSGAGHDAMALAAAGVPIGMIFVPSEEGVSHAPNEMTKAEDCSHGAAVLAMCIQQLAS